MPVRFTNEATVINPPPSPRNSPRISVTLRTPRTRQSGKESRSPKTHSRGRKRKTKVKKDKKSKRGSQKKRGRRASKRQRGGGKVGDSCKCGEKSGTCDREGGSSSRLKCKTGNILFGQHYCESDLCNEGPRRDR